MYTVVKIYFLFNLLHTLKVSTLKTTNHTKLIDCQGGFLIDNLSTHKVKCITYKNKI